MVKFWPGFLILSDFGLAANIFVLHNPQLSSANDLAFGIGIRRVLGRKLGIRLKDLPSPLGTIICSFRGCTPGNLAHGLVNSAPNIYNLGGLLLGMFPRTEKANPISDAGWQLALSDGSKRPQLQGMAQRLMAVWQGCVSGQGLDPCHHKSKSKLSEPLPHSKLHDQSA